MITTYEITLFIYNLTLIPIIFFSVLFISLSFMNLMLDKKKRKFKKLDKLPFISVQIPTFNDPIATRCVEKCMQFNYPKQNYEIIIVDDSTNSSTQKILKKYADNNPEFIKYIHRNNRVGFKPGALNNAMKITNGEILVVFDADWIPAKNFLKEIVKPFSNKKVAIVQSRQGFYNHSTNWITKFAAYLLMVYHTIVMPINDKINCVFFCGTAGAIRRSAFEKVGGWNYKSITEDSELSVKILMKGYQTVYLEMETPSEVPDTFESFVKQQMRWCYGNIRVFFDNAHKILPDKKLSIKQKLMIMYITLGNFAAPMVILMTLFGLSGWFLGNPTLFSFIDVLDLIARFAFTGGFLVMGLLTLYKHKRLNEFKDLVLSAFTVGLVLAFANSFAVIKATFNKKLHWYCTPKIANSNINLK